MIYHSIDIFCHVIDNFGDAGVVYRLAREFKRTYPEIGIRIFIDDLKTLQTVNSAINSDLTTQAHNGIEYIHTAALTPQFVEQIGVADVLVEAFACHIPPAVLDAARSRPRVIINLEYLSAEEWVDGYHLKSSPLYGPHLPKFFFMPGFTKDTGGVILDPRLERIKPRLAQYRNSYLTGLLQQTTGTTSCFDEAIKEGLVGTIFTYQRGFDSLLQELDNQKKENVLLVFGHKSQNSIKATLGRIAGNYGNTSCKEIDGHENPYTPNLFRHGKTHIVFMPFVSQSMYDSLLCRTDFNFVRGEDSLVRAILAGKPFIWNAYIQDGKYQKVKVAAFLKRFAKYFDNAPSFDRYSELMLEFNDAEVESVDLSTNEHYDTFFANLSKIEHATREMSYFLLRHCNLVKKLSQFLAGL